MNLPSLDVLISLITIYIVLALSVSTATSVITQWLGLRSEGLRTGIDSILKDPSVGAASVSVENFWTSSVLTSVTHGDASPKALDALSFATAALSTLPAVLPRDGVQAKAIIQDLDSNAVDPHFKRVLEGLADRAVHRGTSLHDELAQHFDATMDKASRWYKHEVQKITLAIAVILVVCLNANTLDVAQQLTAHPEMRIELTKLAKDLPQTGTATFDAPGQIKDVEKTLQSNGFVRHPFWTGMGISDVNGLVKDLQVIVGLILTILAVSLGAPFWFDVLGRLTGRQPTDRPPSSISLQPMPAFPAPAGGTRPAGTDPADQTAHAARTE